MIIKNSSKAIYTIQADGLLASHSMGDGRMIPAVILQSLNDTKLKELVGVHASIDQGDVESEWSIPLNQILRTKDWYLYLQFRNPIEFNFEIVFNLEKHYILIDAIFESKGLYITQGDSSMKVSNSRKNMILLEIPQSSLYKRWQQKVREIIYKKLKTKLKDSKKMI